VRSFLRRESEPADDAALNGFPPFESSWRSAGAGEWATLAGELDIAQAPLFERTLQEAEDGGVRVIVLDMRNVSFMDIRGMRVITEASDRLREAGGRLILVRGPRAIEMVFACTGAADDLEILDLDDAIEVWRDLAADQNGSAAAGAS
jgi:anti-sigma B factor antagonist